MLYNIYFKLDFLAIIAYLYIKRRCEALSV